MLKFVFCEDPLQPRKADEMYQAEAEAVTSLGLKYAIVNYEALVNDNDSAQAVRRVPDAEEPTLGVFRGWMLRPEQYQNLYDALNGKGIRLINTPAEYRHCHHLPESYSVIEGTTPKSIWLRVSGQPSLDDLMTALAPFGDHPIIVKDFVKSQKHYWNEACFIPSAIDHEAVQRIVKRFLELQGAGLNEGLVFREFVEFEPLTTHHKSGMPLSKEFRIFVLDGKPLYAVQYWEEGEYSETVPPLEKFAHIMKRVKSRFFTMDIAKRKDTGDWMIVELGDAQVAGLPEQTNIGEFYQALVQQLTAD